MLVTLEKGSLWLHDNGNFKSKVKIITVSKNKVVYKCDFDWYRTVCDKNYFLENSVFLKARRRHHNQVKNLPVYFELNDLIGK